MHALLNKYDNREDGFTLIELLIVVLIIGILAAITIPVYLGIQNQAHKSAVKADVNIAVKQVQVAITEGATTISQYGTKNGSDKGESVQVKASTTTGASANDFMVIGSETTTGGAINYTYTYDSATGQFTDSDSGTAFGGGNQANSAPLITSARPTATGAVGTAYTYTVRATGTPAPTLTATGLPTGLTMSSAGVITGTPTTGGTYNYTITATNGTSPDATQTGTITIPTPALYTWDFEDGTTQTWGGGSGNSAGVNNVARTGNYAFYVAGAASYPAVGSIAVNTLTVGNSYTFSGWIYKTSPAAIYLSRSDGTYKTNVVSTTNQWVNVSVTFIANSYSAQWYIFPPASNTAVNANFDDFTLVQN